MIHRNPGGWTIDKSGYVHRLRSFSRKLRHEISRAQSCTSLKIVSPINRFAIESNVTERLWLFY